MGTGLELGDPRPAAPRLSGATGCSSFPLFLTSLSNRHAAFSCSLACHAFPWEMCLSPLPTPALPSLCCLPFLFCAGELGHEPDIWGLSVVAGGWGAQKGDARGKLTSRGRSLSRRWDTLCDQHDMDPCLLRDQTHSQTQSNGKTTLCLPK